MNKIKSFFIGCMLLIIGFAMVVLVVLMYRANEQSKIKSYIFQMDNFANQRVGELQDINEISVISLRNKLIRKYVSEYFRVIPGDTNVANRKTMRDLSGPNALRQWQNGEAKNIAEMSENKIFRMVRVPDDGIATLNQTKNINYNSSELAELVYYSVRYYMYTWMQSNSMETQPIYDQGTLYIEARFKPGIRPDISVKEHLENGDDPTGLFMFQVTNIGSKGI